ncbi:MAG: YciI family protein [Stackebrandtia sp.]
MKYMILLQASQQQYDAMSGRASDKATWSGDDIKTMVAYMHALNEDLVASGEWVEGQGLADPAHARRVQIKDGKPVVTDGPYPESKEVLAGYWVVECDSLDRATEIAARAASCPGPGGVVAEDEIVDVRLVAEAPPSAEG